LIVASRKVMLEVLRESILDELARHGESRGGELAGAFTELDGWTVDEFVEALSSLAVDGHVEVVSREIVEDRNRRFFPFWRITDAGRASLARCA
jgi:hypothetical protein